MHSHKSTPKSTFCRYVHVLRLFFCVVLQTVPLGHCGVYEIKNHHAFDVFCLSKDNCFLKPFFLKTHEKPSKILSEKRIAPLNFCYPTRRKQPFKTESYTVRSKYVQFICQFFQVKPVVDLFASKENTDRLISCH